MKRLLAITSAFVSAAFAVPLITAISMSPEKAPSDESPVIDAVQSNNIYSQSGKYPSDDVSAYIVDDELPEEIENPDYVFDYFEDNDIYLGPNTSDEPETTSAQTTLPPITEAPVTTAPPETTTIYIPPETTTEKVTTATILKKGEKFAGCDTEIVRVYNHDTDKYENMQLGEYLFGVVAAEMPAYFELDALKAQAIACRTFTLYRMEYNNTYHSDYHGDDGADVCTFSGHCQAYMSYTEAVTTWDKAYANAIFDKVKQAVLETSGIVATYDGKLIDAVYHSSSYKMTDSHVNVWTADYPYLVGVSSPEDESFSNAVSTVSYSSSRIRKIILSYNKKALLEDDPSLWLDGYTLNDCGRIDTYTIGNTVFSGSKMRLIFELRSTNFKIKYDKASDRFVFTVYGWGHGVGLSQYGSNLFALQGYDYKYILTHYYTGIKLVTW